MVGLISNAIGCLSGAAFNFCGLLSNAIGCLSGVAFCIGAETFRQMMIGWQFADHKVQILGGWVSGVTFNIAHHPPKTAHPLKMRLFRVTFNIGVGTFWNVMIGLLSTAIGSISGVAFNIGTETFSPRGNWAPFWRRV